MFFVFVGFKLVSELGAAGMGVNNWDSLRACNVARKAGEFDSPSRYDCSIISSCIKVYDFRCAPRLVKVGEFFN